VSDRRNPDEKKAQEDANRDPLSGRAGAHPVGTGIGAVAGGAAAGAAAGAVGGPVGAVAGAAIGGVVGGLAGKGIAEKVDPTVEHGFWRETYITRPYVQTGAAYDEYAPAYEYGWQSQARYQGKTFDESESSLRSEWNKVRGKSNLEWDRAKEAVRDSWERVRSRPSR
jgi:phage tail tape-measure protein